MTEMLEGPPESAHWRSSQAWEVGSEIGTGGSILLAHSAHHFECVIIITLGLFDFGAAKKLRGIAKFCKIRQVKRSPTRVPWILSHFFFRERDRFSIGSQRARIVRIGLIFDRVG